MDTLRQDIRYALRALARNPAFAVVAILTLAIGIGANTAIFSVVQAALLRSLPYKDVDRLVYVAETNPRDGNRIRQGSYPDYLDWRQASVFETSAAYTSTTFFLGSESPERIVAGRITVDFFKTLGTPLTLGRHFTEAEENGEGRAAILSHGFWQRRFASDPNIIGQPLSLSGMTYTIVGVAPAGFHFAPVGPADVWVPLNPSAMLRARRFTHWLSVLARLKEGATIENSQPELAAIGSRIAELDGQFHADSSIRIGALSERIVGNIRPILLGLFVAVGLVLLIACANVANLVLARSAGRQREMAIRVAVGANRRRLVQQLLTETLLLSGIGGLVGVLLAGRGVELLLAAIPESQMNAMLFLADASINGAVLLFSAGAAIVTGIVCGLFPSIQASATNLRAAIAPGRSLMRNVLVVSEVALALVLLISAGLLMKSLVRLMEVDPGFNARNLLTMRISALSDRYAEAPARQAFFRRITETVETLPGVEGASAVDILPLTGGENTGIPTIEGTTAPIDFSANMRIVFPNYFDVMDIPVIQGRTFEDRDTMNAPMVAVVNNAFASRLFSKDNTLGRRMTFAFTPGVYFEIVGVVGDENVIGLDSDRSPVIYLPYSQSSAQSMSLIVRTASDPAALTGPIRAQITGIDATAAVYSVRTIDELISISSYTFTRRYPAMLIGLFAAVAVLLAAIGIYGVIAYSVTQRTRELGVRVALGAQRRNVFGLVLREGALLGGLGVIIGLVAAAGVTRFLSAMLFGVTPRDPVVFGSVGALFMAITLLACYLPARRAMRIDPLTALREE